MTATAMDAVEIDAFLEERHTGVLALADDDDGYAVPVSFAYDDAGPDVYFRLGYAPGSQKRRYVDAVGYASFVTYADTPEGWKSAIARGPLEEVSETGLAASVTEAVNRLDIPYFRVHDRPATELEFAIARIEVAELNGIVEGGG